MELTPVRVVEMALALQHRIAVAEQRKLEWVETEPVQVSPRELLWCMAHIMQTPVSEAMILSQVGRFALVEYTPLESRDPEMCICLAGETAAFHRAILGFQEARTSGRYQWSEWYARAMEAAKLVLTPLRLLHPTPYEADFVIGWLLDVTSTGKALEPRSGYVTWDHLSI